MRARALAACLLFACLPMPATASHGAVHLSELLPSPDETQREFVELWNDGPAIDLAGWSISDGAATPNVYTFGAHTLPTGGRIVLWGGGEADARGPAWTKATVWNNAGDQVILRDAAGNIVDTLAYGSSTWPDGSSDPVPAAPAAGRSLALRDGQWVEAAPTPGSVAEEQAGSVSATVQDVAPQAVFTDVPPEVEPGATFTVAFEVGDDNGDADLASWTLTADGSEVASGTTAGAATASLAAPADRDQWTLEITAVDQAGQQGSDTVTVLVRAAGLAIVVPPGGLSFPAFPPGAGEVLADATFTLRNDGDAPASPRIDFSDLAGPATVAVTGRLDVGYEDATGTTWTAYEGALTQLPELAPGQAVDVRLRLRDIPAPLPAGSYGTSFTVVA